MSVSQVKPIEVLCMKCNRILGVFFNGSNHLMGIVCPNCWKTKEKEGISNG